MNKKRKHINLKKKHINVLTHNNIFRSLKENNEITNIPESSYINYKEDVNRYLYFVCLAGFNDNLKTLEVITDFCKKYNRILIFDFEKSYYNINFSEYFQIKNQDIKIIYDSEEIKKYKYILQHLVDLTVMPTSDVNYKVLAFHNVEFQHANPYNFFKTSIDLQPKLKDKCLYFYNQIKKPYLAIQIRNTDYLCNYIDLYFKNKDYIHSFDTIYIATDDKKVLNFFKEQMLNVINYTTFDTTDLYVNLHESSVNPELKIINLMTDLLLLSQSEKILSCSFGGFIKLANDMFNDKQNVLQKFIQ